MSEEATPNSSAFRLLVLGIIAVLIVAGPYARYHGC